MKTPITPDAATGRPKFTNSSKNKFMLLFIYLRSQNSDYYQHFKSGIMLDIATDFRYYNSISNLIIYNESE